MKKLFILVFILSWSLFAQENSLTKIDLNNEQNSTICSISLSDYNSFENKIAKRLGAIDGDAVLIIANNETIQFLDSKEIRYEKYGKAKDIEEAHLKEIFKSINGAGHKKILADYYSVYGTTRTHSESVNPGKYNFEVDAIATYKTTKWYVNDTLKETDKSGWTAYDPDFDWTFSSGTIVIKAKIYADNGAYEESHTWTVTVVTADIKVTTPSSSTKWKQGESNVDIKWETGNIGGNVKIELYNGSSRVKTITSSTSNDGSYGSYDVPNDISAGTHYRVKVKSLTNNKYDYSNYFEIQGVKSYLKVDAELIPTGKMTKSWKLYVDNRLKRSGSGTLTAEVTAGAHNYYGRVQLGNYIAQTTIYSKTVGSGSTGKGNCYWNKVDVEVKVNGVVITSGYSLSVNSQSQSSPLTYTFIGDKKKNIPIKVTYAGESKTRTVSYGSFGIGKQKFEFTSDGEGSIKPISPETVSAGSEFWVDIKVGDPGAVSNLFGVSFKLNYNTTYLDYVSSESNSWFGDDLVFFPSNDDGAGQVSIGISRKSPALGIDGFGVIARVKFVSLATLSDNETVEFTLSDISATRPDGSSIVLTPISSSTEITTGISVWPGDTNNDGEVNQADVLPLGLFWGATGEPRSNASIEWKGQISKSWDTEKTTFADANGDGVVNQADVLPIGLNWLKTHSLAKIAVDNNKDSVNYEGKLELRFNEKNENYELQIIKYKESSDIIGLSFKVNYGNGIKNIAFNKGKYFGVNLLDFTHSTNNSIGYSIVQKSNHENLMDETEYLANLNITFKKDENTESIEFLNVEAIDITGRRIKIEGIIKEVNKDEISLLTPKDFELAQNYPNPFNPTTIIQYSIPVASSVKLSVYNLVGEEVTTLVDEFQTPGRYSVKFNASNLSSGVYFYKIVTNKQTSIKKLILMK